MAQVVIRCLLPADAARFRALRLRGLREAPTAFGSSYEEECDRPVAEVSERMATNTEGFILGAFDGETLVGTVAMQREPTQAPAQAGAVGHVR